MTGMLNNARFSAGGATGSSAGSSSAAAGGVQKILPEGWGKGEAPKSDAPRSASLSLAARMNEVRGASYLPQSWAQR